MNELRYPTNEPTGLHGQMQLKMLCKVTELWTNPDQVTECPFPWYTFTDQDAWLAKLAEHGIVPDIDEQGNLIF